MNIDLEIKYLLINISILFLILIITINQLNINDQINIWI